MWIVEHPDHMYSQVLRQHLGPEYVKFCQECYQSIINLQHQFDLSHFSRKSIRDALSFAGANGQLEKGIGNIFPSRIQNAHSSMVPYNSNFSFQNQMNMNNNNNIVGRISSLQNGSNNIIVNNYTTPNLTVPNTEECSPLRSQYQSECYLESKISNSVLIPAITPKSIFTLIRYHIDNKLYECVHGNRKKYGWSPGTQRLWKNRQNTFDILKERIRPNIDAKCTYETRRGELGYTSSEKEKVRALFNFEKCVPEILWCKYLINC